MRLSIFLFLCIVFIGVSQLLGCGTDEDIMHGEEVVVEKWVDPVNIGKHYPVKGAVEPGDVVLLSTREEYTVGNADGIVDGVLVSFGQRPDPDEPDVVYGFTIPRGTIVPEGPPIVGLSLYDSDSGQETGYLKPIRKNNNIHEAGRFSFRFRSWFWLT